MELAAETHSAAGDRAPWFRRRLFPLLATVGLIVFGVASTTWWGPSLLGKAGWSLPDDLWATLAAAQRLMHGDLAGLYTPPTRLVTFPGAAVILVPVVAIIDAGRLSLQAQNAHNLHPGVWLVAGPYEIALSGVALFAADAIAERLGADRAKRAVLAGASAVALWSVSARWGHPEDAVAVGLLMYAILALSEARTGAGRVAHRRRRRRPAARAARPARRRDGRRATAPGRLPHQGNHPRGGHAGRRCRGELDGHRPRGDQPAQLGDRRPGDPVGCRRPAHRHRPGGRRRACQGTGHPRGLRLCACRRAPVARGARRAAVEHANPAGSAVVVGRGPGAALGVRVRRGRVLPLADAGGGARRRVAGLVPPHPHLGRGRGGDAGLAADLAWPVELVDAYGRRARPDFVLRPDPGRLPRPWLRSDQRELNGRCEWLVWPRPGVEQSPTSQVVYWP